MPHLLIMTIGPVQGFIAAARKTRDLRYGSWLLSELTKAAAQSLADGNLERLIFPAPADFAALTSDDQFQIVNRVVAIIEGDETAVRAAATTAEQHLNRKIQILWSEVEAELQRKNASYARTMAAAQIRDLPEIFWAAAPFATDNQYAHARTQAEAALAARKTTYDFGATPWQGETLVDSSKSSIDGVREGVIDTTWYPRSTDRTSSNEKMRNAYAEKAARLLRVFSAGPAERLSGVDLLKRLGASDSERHFASTSAVAARPLAERLNDSPAARHAWRAYTDQVKRVGTDVPGFADIHEELLFAERLDDYILNITELESAKKRLRELLRTYADSAEPIPYYALLHADGDRMGEVIDAQGDPTQHRKLSRALDLFAHGVDAIVKAHNGVLIYAGGDDVLALLPLHKALTCVKQLGEQFKNGLEKFHNNAGDSPTLSAGLVVVHHMEPLSDALVLARAAEKHAKQQLGKNGLTVVVNKRSGSPRQVRGVLSTLVDQLTVLGNLLVDQEIASGFAYEVEAMTRVTPQAVWANETLRILDRKKRKRGEEKIDGKIREDIGAMINADASSADTFANRVIVAQIFADARRLAKPPVTVPQEAA